MNLSGSKMFLKEYKTSPIKTSTSFFPQTGKITGLNKYFLSTIRGSLKGYLCSTNSDTTSEGDQIINEGYDFEGDWGALWHL